MTKARAKGKFDVTELSHQTLAMIRNIYLGTLRAGERTKTERIINETAIWKIWNHCRDHKDSMCSDVQCEAIRNLVVDAVQDVQERLENSVVEQERLRAITRELRDELAAAKHKNLLNKKQIGRLKAKVAERQCGT